MIVWLHAAAAFWLSVYLLRRWLLELATQRYCALGDLRHAGTPASMRRKGRAVIVGASITGILAARVCADHYEEVLLVDAEECTIDPSVKRKRVKQHDQLHIFLGLMYPALSKLFPSFHHELELAEGAVIPPQPVVYRGGGIVKLPCSAGDWAVRQLYVSREVLEALLRKLLLQNHRNVSTVLGTVGGIVTESNVVSKVRLRRIEGPEEDIHASLVIDATGTANGSIRWLKKANYQEPVKQTYDPAIVYTCYTFQLTPDMISRYNAVRPAFTWLETGHVGACFSSDHHSVWMKIDNDRVRTMYQTYTGRGGEPETIDDLLAYTRAAQYQQWQKDAIAVICGEGQEQEVSHTKSKVQVGVCYRVKYTSKHMPSNLFPLGDTALRVNPIFGQGCTKSVVDALSLDRVLRRCAPPTVSHQALDSFLDLHYARTDAFWRDTRLQDYACDATTPAKGETSDTGLFHRNFLRWIVKAAQKDQNIGKRLTEVMGALRPFTDYWDPVFLLQCTFAHLVN